MCYLSHVRRWYSNDPRFWQRSHARVTSFWRLYRLPSLYARRPQ
nr:MAG TPA: hypothetical protein [Caudoviricetes sp.]